MPRIYLLVDIFQNHNYDFIHDYIGIPIIEIKPAKAYKNKVKARITGCKKATELG